MKSSSQTSSRSIAPARVWWIGALLLFASAINYMDRQTLANAAVRISREFDLSQEQYGDLEMGFGWAFAVGSLYFGFVADRTSIRRLYAVVLLLWSAVGVASGFVENYHQLLVCRTMLGFFEAGHWPCGIKTVRALLDSKQRALGNSVLQSGTSIGAIATPLLMNWMLTDELGSWRLPFQAVGAVGVLWAVAWLAVVPRDALPAPSVSKVKTSAGIWRTLLDRRMLIILVVVALINTTWQVFRAWLPRFLQEGRGYEESQALYFNAVWFAVTDLGCLGAGVVALWLVRRGQPVVTARLRTFLFCALMALATVFVPWLPKGWLLLAVLLVAGAGALGVFPTYHAFTQDLTRLHQGKVTGVAGVAAWAVSPLAQPLFGRHIDETHSFDRGLALAGCLPIIACALLYLAWPRSTTMKEV